MGLWLNGSKIFRTLTVNEVGKSERQATCLGLAPQACAQPRGGAQRGQCPTVTDGLNAVLQVRSWANTHT